MLFGNRVFNIPDSGLDWQGWLTSVLIGFGTLIIGVLVRFIPNREWSEFSVYFREPEINTAEESLTEVSEIEPKPEPSSHQKTRALTNWQRAIGKTKMQIKVMKAFEIPSSPRSSLSALASPVSYRNSSRIAKKESFVSTIRGGRTSASDYISLQILDANDAVAKANSHH